VHEVTKRSGFKFVCRRTWDSLAPTANPKIRHCDDCGSPVHDCATTDEARAISAIGGCVALGERPSMKTVGGFASESAGFPIVGWFVIADGPHAGRVLEAAEGTRTIGSASHADLVIPDPSVAPVHADITGRASGFTIIARDDRDLVVNGKRVTRCDLVDNDDLVIGMTGLRHKTVN